MIITGNDQVGYERIFIGVTLTRNRWVEELATPKKPLNLRGLCVHLILDPQWTSEGPNPTTYRAPLGIAAGIGEPTASPPPELDHLSAIGILETNLWLFSGHATEGGGKKSVAGELENVAILCQVYGHADRIWTDGSVTANQLWLYHAKGRLGVTKGTTMDDASQYPGLSGVVKVTVTNASSAEFEIDLRGTGLTGTNASTTWETGPSAGQFKKAIVRRETLRTAGGGDITQELPAAARISPDHQYVALHYQENDKGITEPSGEGTTVFTKSPNSVTRGFVMCMGIAPKGV